MSDVVFRGAYIDFFYYTRDNNIYGISSSAVLYEYKWFGYRTELVGTFIRSTCSIKAAMKIVLCLPVAILLKFEYYYAKRKMPGWESYLRRWHFRLRWMQPVWSRLPVGLQTNQNIKMILTQVVTDQWWDLHVCVFNRGFDSNKRIREKKKKKKRGSRKWYLSVITFYMFWGVNDPWFAET